MNVLKGAVNDTLRIINILKGARGKALSTMYIWKETVNETKKHIHFENGALRL